MFSITSDRTNKDIPTNMTLRQAKLMYARQLQGFESRYCRAPVERHQNRRVIRYDLVGGLKLLGAEPLIACLRTDLVTYVAPRQGHAAMAVAELCKEYGQKAVFFAPASRRATSHQLAVLALGHELRFVRVAAMPNLNRLAKAWAEEHGGVHLPFGLADSPLVTAGLINAFNQVFRSLWCQTWHAMSTGTMGRAMKIAWPEAVHRAVAVARNIHPGEKGACRVEPARYPYHAQSKIQPPFPSTGCYDAKAWELCLEKGNKNDVFINVGADERIEQIAASIDPASVDSYREWGDDKDLRRRPEK